MNLLDFCEHGGIFERDYLNAPFQIVLDNGEIISGASNGYIFICRPGVGNYSEMKNEKFLKNVKTMISDHKNDIFLECKNLQLPEKMECETCHGCGKAERDICEECNGDGVVEFNNDFNEYEIECKTCDGWSYSIIKGEKSCFNCLGAGYTFKRSEYLNIFDVYINPAFYELISDLKGLRFSALPAEYRLYFNADDGIFGVIMGCRL